jgi:hypothetical protein
MVASLDNLSDEFRAHREKMQEFVVVLDTLKIRELPEELRKLREESHKQFDMLEALKLSELPEELKKHKEASQKYFTILDALKWVIGLSALAVVTAAIGGSISVNSTISTINATLVQHEKTFAKHDKSLEDLSVAITKQTLEIGKLENTLVVLAKENKNLVQVIEQERIFVRDGERKGFIVATKVGGLPCFVDDKTKFQTVLYKDTKVFINGKEDPKALRMLQENHAPVVARIIRDDNGFAQRVEIRTEANPK